MAVCDHCGQETGITYGAIWTGKGDIKLCHTGYPGRPDCYRRVTVYKEHVGVLKNVHPVPDGINDIREPRIV